MTDLRAAAQQALEALETVFMPHHPAVIALKAALGEEALQRLTDANQEIEAALEQQEQVDVLAEYTGDGTHRQWVSTGAWLMPGERVLHAGAGYSPRCPNCASLEAQNTELDRKLAALEQPERPNFTLSCGCPSQHGGVPAYWERDGSTAFGMICEKHWHEYDARSEA
jgi:hypothetical protein